MICRCLKSPASSTGSLTVKSPSSTGSLTVKNPRALSLPKGAPSRFCHPRVCGDPFLFCIIAFKPTHCAGWVYLLHSHHSKTKDPWNAVHGLIKNHTISIKKPAWRVGPGWLKIFNKDFSTRLSLAEMLFPGVVKLREAHFKHLVTGLAYQTSRR